MTPEATQALLSWEPVSPRILTARFNSKGRRVTIIQCYAPTNMADIEDKIHFYQQIQPAIGKVPARDMKILITSWLWQNSRPSSRPTTTRPDAHHTNSMYSAWKIHRNQRNSKLNWGTSSACFPYSQNSGTVCERPGRRHAQQPWAGRRGSTKSGLHLTPGHLSPRGRTLKTESTRRKIKRKSTNYRLCTGRRTDRWRKVQGRTKEATLRSWLARQRLPQANETWRDCTR